jgi:PIN domain nuclease of toxin-antitoxin system
MTLLLDTCAALWLVAGANVSAAAKEALAEAQEKRSPVLVSPITGWEIGLLALRGRFASPHPPKVWFERLLMIDGVQLAGLAPSTLIDSSFLPGQPPRDPADRIIIATAREQTLRIMTRDRLILDYGKAGHVLTLAC